MIQRIQTVYLLIVAILSIVLLFLPLAVLQIGNDLLSFDVSGLSTMLGEKELIYATWSLFALDAIIIMLAFVTIFLFKNRVLQIRITIFNALLKIGFYCLFGYLIYTFKSGMDVISLSVKFALSFPLIGIILDYLAIRSIGADEALIRSLNRLR